MDIVKKEIKDLAIIEKSNLNKQTLAKELLNSKDGTLFVVDKFNVFKGIITVGDYLRMLEAGIETIEVNQNCRFIYETQNLYEKLMDICINYPNIKMVPILSSENKILYAFHLPSNHFYYYDYFKLCALMYRLKIENTFNLHDYLIENKCKNVAIFGGGGINNLTLLLGDELKKYNDIEQVCIYGNANNLYDLILFDYMHNSEFYCIDSIDEIIESKKFDIIIVTDLSIKSYDKFKSDGIKIKSILEIAREITFSIVFKSIKNLSQKLNNNGIDTVCVSIPPLDLIKNLRESTLKRLKRFELNNDLRELSDEDANLLFGELGGKEYALELGECFAKRDDIIKVQGVKRYTEYRSKYINCVNGNRLIPNPPEVYDNTIYLVGNCVADSFYAEDKHTVGNYLQDMILAMNSNIAYRVVASSATNNDFLNNDISILENLENEVLKKGDIIVFIYTEDRVSKSYVDIDMTQAFNKLYDKEEFFLDTTPAHCTYKGYKVVASEIFNYLKSSYFENHNLTKSNEIIPFNKLYTPKLKRTIFGGNLELNKYVKSLKKFKVDNKNIIGSIVMNCNPFTLGHRYLIETAAKQVDWLYIFVVEEDKSIFPFKDRFELVNQNVKDLNNITVLPSGKFIISSITFSEYFNKDISKNLKVDTSTDIEVFAQHIVKALDINVRFVGEEPFDNITNQYNQTMKTILPRYNVKVVEIKRKTIDSEIISAFKVRKLLNDGNLKEAKKFLTPITFDYLLKHYNFESNYQLFQNRL